MPTKEEASAQAAPTPGRKPVGGEFPTEKRLPGATFRDFWRWRRARKKLIRAHERRGERLPEVDPDAGRRLRDASDSITWAGHASVITRLSGHTILSDPVWSKRVGVIVKRMTPAAPKWDDLPNPEYVTISHNHYDHMDASTIRKLRKTATFLVPRGVGEWFRKRRFTKVHELDWWQTLDLDGVKATFVPAKHFSGRTLRDRDKSLYGGWILEDGRHRVYHAGDSGYFDGFRAIGERFRSIDVACLPIGAYEPRWFMAPYHVNPDEAGQAFLDVNARQLLPIHWGTFRLSDEAMDEPPAAVARFFQARSIGSDRLLLPRLGETMPLAADAG